MPVPQLDFLTYQKRTLADAVFVDYNLFSPVHGFEGEWRCLAPDRVEFVQDITKPNLTVDCQTNAQRINRVYTCCWRAVSLDGKFARDLKDTGSGWLSNDQASTAERWWEEPVFWGCHPLEGRGHNILGKILMDIRWNWFGYIPDEIPF